MLDSYDPRDVRSARDHFRKISAREREFSALVDPNASTKGFTPLHYACLATTTNARKVAAFPPRVPTHAGRLVCVWVESLVTCTEFTC